MRFRDLIPVSLVLLLVASGGPARADDFQDAERLYRAGDLMRAEAVYAKVPVNDAKYLPSLLRRGTICYATGRPARAATLFEDYLHLRPTAEAYCLLAGTQFNLKDYDHAYESAKMAARLDPKYAHAYTALGMIYTAISDWPDAQAAYRESLRLDPGDADTWFMLGRAYFLRDDFPGAREAFGTSLRLNPQQTRGYENLALTLDLMNQADSADETYRLGIKIAQDHKYSDPQIYVDYGKFLAKHERAAESLMQLREAVRVAPQNPQAHCELANQLFRMKEWTEAAREGETALRVGPPEYRVHYLLARIYTALGDSVAAARHAGEAARLTDQRP